MKRDEIYRIVEAKYEDYSDRVVMQMKALPKDRRQSGDDSVLEDVWEEFKYQVQKQESVLFEAYEETITAICHQLVESLPQHEQDLLWLVSEGYWKVDDEDGLPPRDDIVENVVTELYGRVSSRASDEDLKNDPDAESDVVNELDRAVNEMEHPVSEGMDKDTPMPPSQVKEELMKPGDMTHLLPTEKPPRFVDEGHHGDVVQPGRRERDTQGHPGGRTPEAVGPGAREVGPAAEEGVGYEVP